MKLGVNPGLEQSEQMKKGQVSASPASLAGAGAAWAGKHLREEEERGEGRPGRRVAKAPGEEGSAASAQRSPTGAETSERSPRWPSRTRGAAEQRQESK